MTDRHDMLSWASLCFVTILITFCFYFFVIWLCVCLVSKMCKSFDREKKKKKSRLCTDYKELNKKNFHCKMPLPRIQDILDNLGDQKYFMKLDMSKTYHQGFL